MHDLKKMNLRGNKNRVSTKSQLGADSISSGRCVKANDEESSPGQIDNDHR